LREKLEEEIETAKRTNTPLTILLFDVDDFKQVNDLYGHQIGDRLLMELSATVTKFLRKNDLAVRYGGEEFLIMLPGLSITEAQQRAEQIRKAVQRIRISNKGHLIKPITITIGIATFPYHGQIYRELLQAADLALYLGKNQGKDCVVIANVSFEDAIRNHYISINKDQNE
jgi:diguanylate cyclase (GGDEF)-like protein